MQLQVYSPPQAFGLLDQRYFDQGDKMKQKNKQNEEERRQARRTIWMRVIAIFLAVVFLASECSTLLPIE